jgi:hypothetical protein
MKLTKSSSCHICVTFARSRVQIPARRPAILTGFSWLSFDPSDIVKKVPKTRPRPLPRPNPWHYKKKTSYEFSISNYNLWVLQYEANTADRQVFRTVSYMKYGSLRNIFPSTFLIRSSTQLISYWPLSRNKHSFKNSSTFTRTLICANS